jgi:hypothetical protein
MNGPGMDRVNLRRSRQFVPEDSMHLATAASVNAFSALHRVNYAGYVGVL